MNRENYADKPEVPSCLSCLLDINLQSGFLQNCFSMALSSIKRCFPSKPWNFPVVISVRSGNATNPLTQKPAEVRSCLGYSHISWGRETNGRMRRVRRSKIIHSLLLPCKARRKKPKRKAVRDCSSSSVCSWDRTAVCDLFSPLPIPQFWLVPGLGASPWQPELLLETEVPSAEGLWDWTHNLLNY